ncbi:conjugal transfer protein TraV [Sphingomonas sp. Leaf28]|uniref:conjugal transfer protein TraV n=1 Tax=Sphingomonas sp. Leaf28 TaxID=1735695 RepID=UPI000AAD07C8|nr:conjugal transfer protein TraV [Sphingomonas sp. Leaf28]
MNKVHVCLAVALASGTIMTGCTTMGGNIKGNFSCMAPDGICAPSSTIDDRALAMIAGEDGDRMITPAGPYSTPQSAGRGFDTAAAAPARSQERVLRIVFPAQIDGAGRLHEQTAVHAVVERGEWQRALASNAVATTPAQVQAATGGDTLIAAVDRADPPIVMEDSSIADPDMPSAAAVAAARVQADPVGDIKDQVARRLSKTPRRLSVSPSALRTPTALTYSSKPAAPTTNMPVAVGMTTNAKPLPSPAPVRPVVTSTSVITPKYATPAGRTAIAAVGANPAVRAGLARAEPEAREAAKGANPLSVLRASSFPGVVQ